MEIIPVITGVAALGVNVHAAAALVLGMRAREARVIARHARRCAWSAAAFAGLMVVGVGRSLVTEAPRGDSPAERATRLARTISEGMNAAAFMVLVLVLPVVAAVALHVRAARRAK